MTAGTLGPDRVENPTPVEFEWRDLVNPSTEPLGPKPSGIGPTTLTGSNQGRATIECEVPGRGGVVSHRVPTSMMEARAADKSLSASQERDATNWYQKWGHSSGDVTATPWPIPDRRQKDDDSSDHRTREGRDKGKAGARQKRRSKKSVAFPGDESDEGAFPSSREDRDRYRFTSAMERARDEPRMEGVEGRQKGESRVRPPSPVEPGQIPWSTHGGWKVRDTDPEELPPRGHRLVKPQATARRVVEGVAEGRPADKPTRISYGSRRREEGNTVFGKLADRNAELVESERLVQGNTDLEDRMEHLQQSMISMESMFDEVMTMSRQQGQSTTRDVPKARAIVGKNRGPKIAEAASPGPPKRQRPKSPCRPREKGPDPAADSELEDWYRKSSKEQRRHSSRNVHLGRDTDKTEYWRRPAEKDERPSSSCDSSDTEVDHGRSPERKRRERARKTRIGVATAGDRRDYASEGRRSVKTAADPSDPSSDEEVNRRERKKPGSRKCNTKRESDRSDDQLEDRERRTRKSTTPSKGGEERSGLGPRLKLETFDGKTAVAAFLAKFELCATYYHWSDKERTAQLLCSLTGTASQLLWDMGAQKNVTWQEMVRKLQTRYGSEEQTSLFRIQLRTYRQGHGESLSNVVQEIRRLVSLAYPGPTSDIIETIACDAFADALRDQDLAQKVREREPRNLDAAYKHAVRLDAYGRSSTQYVENDRRQGRVKFAQEERGAPSEEYASKRFDTIEREMKRMTDALSRITSTPVSAVTPSRNPDSDLGRPDNRNGFRSGNGNQGLKRFNSNFGRQQLSGPRGQQRTFEDMECYGCHQKGHMFRVCPQNDTIRNQDTSRQEAAKTEPVTDQAQSRLVQGSRMAYITARFEGKQMNCLLDSGSEMSLVPRRLVTESEIIPSAQRLLAANGSEIHVYGETLAKIQIGSRVYPLLCLVTEQINEVIIGLSWLERHGVVWDFAKRFVQLGKDRISLREAVNDTMCRKVMVREDTIVPSWSEIDVPVTVVYPHLQLDNEAWTTTPGEVRQDLLIGRALVTERDHGSWIRFANIGPNDSLVKGNSEYPLERVEVIDAAGPKEPAPPREEPEVLKRLWTDVPVEVTGEDRDKLKNLVLKYETTFSLHEDDNGFTSVIQHEIDTGQERPVRQPLRRQPLTVLPMIDQQLTEMLEQGIVEPSMSEWASNVVMVKKKDGSMRFCIDYRQLNLKTRKDAHPLPLIRESLDTLGGASWYSTFDLRAGYHQLALHPRDKHKTAFVTRKGSFQFTVLPFGLCNSPASFSRLMNLVLSGLNYEVCLVYLDDIIVFSKDIETHLQRLELVFQRLQKFNLKLKPSKCHLLQQRVLFLGHILSKEGVATDPSKIRAVEEWTVPKNVRQVRSFVGLCSYYRRFIDEFAEIAKPLHYLTRKRVPFLWDDECQHAFEELKKRLITSPILGLPRDGGRYVLDTDASAYAIGAVLSQKQDGEDRVIAFASRLLSPAERNYNVTRRELLAVVYFLKEFRQYLLGQKFVLRTDHSALQWLRRTPEPIGQQARWLETIEEFDLEIQHRAGAQHGNADALSRGPEPVEADETGSLRDGARIRPITVRASDNTETESDNIGKTSPKTPSALEVRPRREPPSKPVEKNGWTPEYLRAEQRKDDSIGVVLGWREKNLHPRPEELAPFGEEVKVLVSNWNQLEVRNGVLHRTWIQESTGNVERHQLVTPAPLRQQVIEFTHTSCGRGHFGIRKSLLQLRQRAYWPSWKEDVRRYCQRCDPCARYRREKPPRQGLMQKPVVGEPMERFGIDITGPHPISSRGNKYILTAIDYFSRWAEAIPIRNQEATTVAENLMIHVFSRFGMPRQILTDQGPCFESKLFQELCKLMEIDKLRTTPYRPSGNGMVERFHRTLNMLIGKVVTDRQKDWDLHVPYVMAAYRSTEHEATKRTPNFLFLGRENHTPLDLILAQVSEVVLPEYTDVEEYVEQQTEKMQTAYKLVREQLKKTAERRKKKYDLRVRKHAFNKGEWVYYFYPRLKAGVKTKWARNFVGPFLVIQVLSPVLYRIQRGARSPSMVVHIDKLKAYHGIRPKNWATAENQEGFELEELFADRLPEAVAEASFDDSADHPLSSDDWQDRLRSRRPRAREAE